MLEADEVAKQSSDEDCWVIVCDAVYDVTKFLKEHPGGAKSAMLFAGQDATEEIEVLHDRKVIKKHGLDASTGKLENWVVRATLYDYIDFLATCVHRVLLCGHLLRISARRSRLTQKTGIVKEPVIGDLSLTALSTSASLSMQTDDRRPGRWQCGCRCRSDIIEAPLRRCCRRRQRASCAPLKHRSEHIPERRFGTEY